MSTFAFSRNVSCLSMVKSLRPHAGEILRLSLVNGHWSWLLIGWWGGAWVDPNLDNCKKWHWQICMQRQTRLHWVMIRQNGIFIEHYVVHVSWSHVKELSERWTGGQMIWRSLKDKHLFNFLLNPLWRGVPLSSVETASVCPCLCLYAGSPNT